MDSCHYVGFLQNQNGTSRVALSNCKGLVSTNVGRMHLFFLFIFKKNQKLTVTDTELELLKLDLPAEGLPMKM